LGTTAAAVIPRKNYFFGRWLRCSYPDYTGRLLRKGAGSYNELPGKGFDTLLANGRTVRLKNPLVHFTGESVAQRVKKIDFQSTLRAEENFRTGARSSGFTIIGHALFAFCSVYFLKRGFREGTRGLVHAGLTAFGTFLKYAKLWEKGLDEPRPLDTAMP